MTKPIETCVITVQMMSDAGDIPGESAPGHTLPFTDIAALSDIDVAAETVFQKCVIVRDRAGWTSAGKHIITFDSQTRLERS